MKYTTTILFCLFFTLSFSQSNGDRSSASQKQITFRDVTVEDGLSQNSVVSIAQDSIGYLWFATQDGLNRYDGKTFKYYNKRFDDITRPTYSQLGKVYVDKLGQLWIITTSGVLEKYNKKTDSFIIQSKFKNVSSIYQNDNLDYYIGTMQEGIYKIDAISQDTLRLKSESILNKKVNDFYSSKGKMFALTSNGIVELDNYKIVIPETPFSSVTDSKDGRIWIGSFGKGLNYLDGQSRNVLKFVGFNDQNTIPSNLNIQSLLIDSHDRLWVATYGNGVYLVDRNQEIIRHFTAEKTNPFALHYNDVLSLYEDYTGTIWLGTDGAGLSYYDENLFKFNVLTNNQTPVDINVDVVRAIAVDDTQKKWLGTSGKGLTSYDAISNSFKTYTTTNSGINSNRIMSLLANNKELWIGFQGSGLNILGQNGDFKNFEELSGYTIWKIYKDSKNRVWLCTRDNGLVQFDKSKGIIREFNSTNSAILSNNIRTIEEDNNETLWIGTETKGLYKLNVEGRQITRIDGVVNNIKSLYQANNNLLWIGTNGNGLNVYNSADKTVKVFDMENGLPNNVIYSVLPDDENNLWLSSNRGITKFKSDENFDYEIVNYNNYDGLQALEFNTGAYFKNTNGDLYFGGLDGVNWFKPNALTKNPVPPKTVVNKLEVFSEVRELIPNAEFAHNQNTITLGFAGLHFSLPERNNYKYRLLPYDDDWVDAKNISAAYYPKLPPDAYTFQVLSSNYDNVWNEEPTIYNFKIKQPWYFNTLTKSLYALLLLLSGIAIYRYLKWRWHIKMQLKFEHEETERLKKLDEFKSKLYTNISHEFRTPLTLISGPIDRQLSRDSLAEEDKKELTMVQRNAKRLLNLVNQMLDLSKLESGSLKLQVTNGSLSALLHQITSVFNYKAEDKQIDFKSNIANIGDAWFDKDVIEKVITNLLANAIKYAPKGGNVYFDANVKDGQVIMSVINNGNQITDDELGKLFMRFYQTNKSSDGVGIGLSLVKELTILSHGNIVAHTMNEDDIQFTVTLPIERSYFNQSEIIFNEILPKKETAGLQDIFENDIISEYSEEKKPLLLIVEDDDDVREYIKSIFKNNYKLYEASHGKQGVEMALEHVPDLIISDIMMPIVNGIELCNTLKQDEKTSHIPIILLTAKVGEENEIKGLKTGADAYVTKPFNDEKLQVRVSKLIELRKKLQSHYNSETGFVTESLSKSSVDEAFIKHLHEILSVHISNPDCNSEMLCNKLGMSRMQLHRKLKALTGSSTSEFLKTQRLKLAIPLLKKTDLTISEIAYEVGFNTPSYFTKCFKDIYNCTPNEYLEQA